MAKFGFSARGAADTARVAQQFWSKLRGNSGVPFAEDAVSAYYCAFDRETPTRVRAALLGALAYFILPADTIPDILPGLGFTDDAALLAATIQYVASHIRAEHRAAARNALAGLGWARKA